MSMEVESQRALHSSGTGLDEPVEIRRVGRDDAARLAEIYRPYVESTSVSFEVDPPSAAEFAERVERLTRDFPWLVCESEGRVVGYAYGARHRERAAYRWSVDVAVYVDQGFHRRGLGRQLYSELLSQLRRLGYFNAFAGITLPNEKSVGLHEAMGFTRVGVYRSVGYKLGRWHDVGWWQLKLRDEVRDPSEPTRP